MPIRPIPAPAMQVNNFKVRSNRPRMRSRSSPVAARVKVTTRICSIVGGASAAPAPSTSSRRTSEPMAWVLPVPALASTRRGPARSTVKASKGAGAGAG